MSTSEEKREIEIFHLEFQRVLIKEAMEGVARNTIGVAFWKRIRALRRGEHLNPPSFQEQEALENQVRGADLHLKASKEVFVEVLTNADKFKILEESDGKRS